MAAEGITDDDPPTNPAMGSLAYLGIPGVDRGLIS